MRTSRRGVSILMCCLGLAGLTAGAEAADLPPVPPPALPVAAPLPWFVRLGVTAVLPDTDIAARLAGVPVAGGNGSIGAVPAVYVEAGYYVLPNVAISLAGGYPPTLTTRGTGTLAPFGTLYRSQVALPVLEATYHLDLFGPFRPYAGVGVGYAIVFRNEAGAVQAPNLRDKVAFVLVGGIDYALSDRWGVFVDVKKAFLSQRFTGLGAPFPGGPAVLPVSARVRSDPLLVSAGVSYGF